MEKQKNGKKKSNILLWLLWWTKNWPVKQQAWKRPEWRWKDYAKIHVTFNHNCVYRENYATVKMSMGRIFVSVFTSESRCGICMRGFPDTRIITLLTQLMPYNRCNCGRASYNVIVKVQSILQCPQFPQSFIAFACITRALWNPFLWWLLSVSILVTFVIRLFALSVRSRLSAGRYGFHSPDRSDRLWKPTRPLLQRLPGGVTAEGKAVEPEAVHSFPSKAEVKNY